MSWYVNFGSGIVRVRAMHLARAPAGRARAHVPPAEVQQRVHEQDARVQDEHAEHGAHRFRAQV